MLVLTNLESWQIDDLKKLLLRSGVPAVIFLQLESNRYELRVVNAADYHMVAGMVRAFLHGFQCGMKHMQTEINRAHSSALWATARVVEPADSWSRIQATRSGIKRGA